MKKFHSRILKSKKLPWVFSLGAGALILLSGAAYAPALLQTQTIPIPIIEVPVTASVPTPVQILPQSTLRTSAPKSSLAQRLNGRYQISHFVHASA